jgi:DNA-binding NtrC family response regulator
MCENAPIKAAFTFGRSDMIDLRNLPPAISGKREQREPRGSSFPALRTFADVERDIVARALEMAGGNKVHAARTLKIARKRLYAKIEKYVSSRARGTWPVARRRSWMVSR